MRAAVRRGSDARAQIKKCYFFTSAATRLPDATQALVFVMFKRKYLLSIPRVE